MKSTAKKTVTGACFCRAVRFAVTLPTLFCAHCHCSMCRRSHGAGFVTWLGVPRGQFEVTGGSEQLVHYASSDHGRRSFCRTCGTTLLCESDHNPDRVDVVLANMDGPIDREPELHAYYSDRAGWVAVDDGLPRFGGETGVEPIDD